MNKIEIYIGSPNETRKISNDYLSKITKWAKTVFPEGYTLLNGKGYYENITEDSVLIISVCESESDLKQQVQKLKVELNQKSILVVKTPIDYVTYKRRIFNASLNITIPEIEEW